MEGYLSALENLIKKLEERVAELEARINLQPPSFAHGSGDPPPQPGDISYDPPPPDE